MKNLINARATTIERMLLEEKLEIDQLLIKIMGISGKIFFIAAVVKKKSETYKLISKHYTNFQYLKTICEKIKKNFNTINI